MKNIVTTILFLLFAIPALASQYQVTRVVDGDTIDVIYKGKKERIRMLNVDTPESVHPDQSRNTAMGKKASAYTKSRLAGKTVDLEFQAKKRGRYGRLLAYVIVDGRNYSMELVKIMAERLLSMVKKSPREDPTKAPAIRKITGIK